MDVEDIARDLRKLILAEAQIGFARSGAKQKPCLLNVAQISPSQSEPPYTRPLIMIVVAMFQRTNLVAQYALPVNIKMLAVLLRDGFTSCISRLCTIANA